MRTGVEVSRILIEGGRARGVLADGEAIRRRRGAAGGRRLVGRARHVASASGCPVAPVRGQMLAVSNVPPLITHAIHGDDIYLVPRPSGELLIGATVEHAGFQRAVTPDGLGSLIAAGGGARARDRPPVRSPAPGAASGPAAPDGQPVLGPWPDVAGLFVGHRALPQRHPLAPITAALMTHCIVDGDTPASITPFLPQRFARH